MARNPKKTSSRRHTQEVTAFEKTVRDLFSFLESEYGARLHEVKNWKGAGTFVTYCNATTGVEISLQPRDGGILLEVIRLKDGTIPPKIMFYSPDMIVDRYAIQDLVEWKAPAVHVSGHLQVLSFNPPVEELREILVRMAKALQKYCGGVLRGDFRSLGKLDVMIKKRAAEWHQAWREGRLLEKVEEERRRIESTAERGHKVPKSRKRRD